MPDLVNRLAALHDPSPGSVADDVVAADLRRGRAALRIRRRRRIGAAGVAAVAVVAGSVSYAVTSDSGTPQAAPSHAVSVPATQPPASRTRPASSTPAPTNTIELVAYQGKQLPGYTVKRVPDGYVLQGISGSVLDVAAEGDHSSLDTFVGKIVVMLNDHPGVGKPVTVNGGPGKLDDQDGVQILTYTDHGRNVAVQSWSNIHITSEQLIQFAEGVTVLPNAQEGHG